MTSSVCSTGIGLHRGAESTTSTNGHITLEKKLSGKPVAGKRHDGFDVAGIGNVRMGAGLRPNVKTLEMPPYPANSSRLFSTLPEGGEARAFPTPIREYPTDTPAKRYSFFTG